MSVNLWIRCIRWNDIVDNKDQDESMIIQLQTCGHSICIGWLKSLMEDQYVKEFYIACTECLMIISEWDILKAITEGELLDYQGKALKAIHQDEADLIKCKCNNYIEVSQGEVNYEVKDENGAIISKESAEHMSKWRVRCPDWTINFWIKWGLETYQPYHTGFTCEQYEKRLNNPKCRFCTNHLEDKKNCANKECIEKVSVHHEGF